MEKNFQKCINGIQHIGIPTNDISKTIAFSEMLGFQVAYKTLNEKANEEVAFLELGDVVIETYENKNAALKSGALDHLALDTSDIQGAYRLAKEKGCRILDDGIQFLPFWENGVNFFTILGPNEEKIEFCQRL